jgi:hypothetical protein
MVDHRNRRPVLSQRSPSLLCTGKGRREPVYYKNGREHDRFRHLFICKGTAVIRSDIDILATYAEVCFNEHFLWSQSFDPEIGFHLVSRFFINAGNLEFMIQSRKKPNQNSNTFENGRGNNSHGSDQRNAVNRDVQGKMMDLFLKAVFEQLKQTIGNASNHKRNFFILGHGASVIVARLILGGTHIQVDNPKLARLTGLPVSFDSTIHKKTINCQESGFRSKFLELIVAPPLRLCELKKFVTESKNMLEWDRQERKPHLGR